MNGVETLLETYRRFICSYLNALSSGATGSDLVAFFTPDAEQIEMPNNLNLRGGRNFVPDIVRAV